ncbi:hypothetical protein TNCV_4922661 [Trichonephila clavipes]|nr:hypothetical protein TNCV_4922661 [Trichonephila clavipes]
MTSRSMIGLKLCSWNANGNKSPGDGSHPINNIITNTLENFFAIPPPLPLIPTNPDEILEYIKSLKNNKAPGSDLISNKMLPFKDFPAKTEDTTHTVPIATPPYHILPTNQDSLIQPGPSTSGHIDNLDMGWRNASRSVSQWHPAL